MTSTAPGAHPPPEEVDALLDLSGGDARVSAHVESCERCSAGARRPARGPGPARRPGPHPPPGAARPRCPDRRRAGRRAAAAAVRRRCAPAAVPAQSAPVTDALTTPGLGGPVRGRPGARPAPTSSLARVPRGRRQRGGRRARWHLPGRHPRRWRASDAATSAELSSADSGDSGGGAAAPSVSVPPGSLPGPVTTAERGRRAVLRHPVHPRRPGRPGERSPARRRQRSGHPGDRAGRPGVRGPRPRRLPPAVGRSGVEPAVTDVATFEGQPAVVLVLPSGRGYDVLVVPAACGSGDDRVLASAYLE